MLQNANMDAALLTVKDVAKQLSVSTAAIYRLVKDGRLAALHVGLGTKLRYYRFRKPDVDAFLESLAARRGVIA